MRRIRFALGVVAIVLLVLGPMVGSASAHPLGNFTVNQAAHVIAGMDRIVVEHVVDMAEVPTIQERARIDSDDDGEVSSGERSTWARRACDDIGASTSLTVEDEGLTLVAGRSEASFLPGQAGLKTLRLECALTADLPASRGDVWHVGYEMGAYPDRLGWREVTAQGDGTTLLDSDVDSESPSDGLRRYPKSAEASPLDQRSAQLEVGAGGPAAAPGALAAVLPPGADGAAQSVLGFLGGQQLGIAVGLAALAISTALGATHALAPGHGKTIIAATMLGPNSRVSQALTLGVSVALSHTAAVLILAVILSTTTLLVPERLYPLLAVASGVMVLAVGSGLARRAWKNRSDPAAAHSRHHDHGHTHDHEHPHPGHGHGHHHHGIKELRPGLTRRSLIALGLAGGLVPAPSAIIVLLGASAFGQAWFGVLLVVAYGIGMAGTLFVAAWLAIRIRALAGRRLHGWESRVTRLLPLATSAVVVLAGLALGARGISGLI